MKLVHGRTSTRPIKVQYLIQIKYRLVKKSICPVAAPILFKKAIH